MTDDLISRQAAIDTVFSMCCRWDTDDPNDLKIMLLTAFQELPTAQERKKGKWEKRSYDSYQCSNCSTCAITRKALERVSEWSGLPKFCPNCGAEMSKGEA